MAIVDAAIAVGTMVGVGGGGAMAGLAGGALLGAGAGALYSGVTGDGNILNSALNGALIGGGIGGIGGAIGATGMSGSLFGANAPAAGGMFSSAGSAMFPGAVAPVSGVGAPTLGAAVAPTAAEFAPAAGYVPSSGTASLEAMANTQAAEDMAAGASAGPVPAGTGAGLNTYGTGTPGFWDSTAGTAAKWGAGLMAANSIISNSNKKYGTLSPSQTTSLPLQYQSNFGTYQPLDTSVMRPMGAPAGYNGTPYGTPGYVGSRVGYAAGGITQAMPSGGPVEQMSQDNSVGQNQSFPQANLQTPAFSSATNTPMGSNMIAAAGDTNVDPYSGAEKFVGGGAVQHYDLGGFIQNAAELPMNQFQTAMDNPGQALIGANTPFETNVWNSVTGSHMAPTTDMYGVPTGAHRPRYAVGGGITDHSSLGSYAAGGNPRLLKGPGDGMSDNIPAQIGASQPARLADGEFVVPADVVSHLGNGSTDAGAKRLHSMMDNVRKARTGRKAQGKQIKADKFVPK